MMNLRMVKCHKRRQRFGTCFVTMVYCTSCLASKPHGWGPSPTWTHPCHLPLEKHVQDSSNKHQVMGRFKLPGVDTSNTLRPIQPVANSEHQKRRT